MSIVVRATMPLLASLCFVSCEDVLPLELSNIQGQIVIEGIVSNAPSSSKVSVSLTHNAYEKGEPKVVSGALVTLSDDTGASEVLKEGQPGVFVPSIIAGSPGRRYRLTVSVSGQEFSAVSKMPAPMSLDSIRFVKSTSIFSFGASYLRYYLTDKPGIEEYCVIRAHCLNSNVYYWTLYSDRYSEGKQVLVESPDFTLTNTTIIVEVLAVDKAGYDYFYSLREVLGKSITIPDFLQTKDYNPATNLSNNALGYFSAQALTRDTVTIR
jgi:hypothetical protein